MMVLDASAVLAALFSEPGGEIAARELAGGLLSAVNLAEVLTRFARDGHNPAAVADRLVGTGLTIVPFSAGDAVRAAALAPLTRVHCLSVGDRACLALAAERYVPVLTADRVWSELGLSLEVRLIR